MFALGLRLAVAFVLVLGLGLVLAGRAAAQLGPADAAPFAGEATGAGTARALALPPAFLPPGDRAAPGLVVVELFTSQGCPNCPPADALLAELAQRGDVLALALHVDYWDYIGWPDAFASPAFSARQKAYARAEGHRMLYTPQMVVDGADHVVGFRPLQAVRLIEAHAAARKAALVTLRRGAGELSVQVQPASPGAREDERLALHAQADVAQAGMAPAAAAPVVDAARMETEPAPHIGGLTANPAEVQLVRFRPLETVAITHGENAGRTVSYVNIVTDWQVVGAWDGERAARLSLPLSGPEAAAVIVQTPGAGPILGAAFVE